MWPQFEYLSSSRGQYITNFCGRQGWLVHKHTVSHIKVMLDDSDTELSSQTFLLFFFFINSWLWTKLNLLYPERRDIKQLSGSQHRNLNAHQMINSKGKQKNKFLH